MTLVDKRLMLMAGFLFFAVGTWWMTYLTSDWDFYELLWPQIFRGVGLMLSIIPINDISLGTLPPERVKNASGLFNLMRNLGGACRACGPDDDPQRPHRPASGAPARGDHVVARARHGDAQRPHRSAFSPTAAMRTTWR